MSTTTELSGASSAPPKSTAPLTPEQRSSKGKAARSVLPRSAHGEWAAEADRADPMTILERQEATRAPELVPLRHGRMAASAFAFYRGAAAVMAADLASAPRTGLNVQLCGDAHLVNFGGFGAPDRRLLFDLNDFDETHHGPFEWDVKRLAASFEVAGRDRGLTRKESQRAVASATRAYRDAMREFSVMGNLDVWYSRLDVEGIKQRWGAEAGAAAMKNLATVAAKAETKNHLKAFNKLTERVNGEVRFVSDPPLLVPVRELLPDVEAELVNKTITESLRRYRHTLSSDRRHLFDRYQFVDLARKVVGVGSVGTRCWVALLVGRDDADPLFLQVKEAEQSVLEPFIGRSEFSNHGQRVVEGQRLMQAASDILLGFDELEGVDGVRRDYYMRQMWDWKVSGNVETMTPAVFAVYGQICGWTLARSHARSGDTTAITAYLGNSASFDLAMINFANAYADQNERDHRRLCDAITNGEVLAANG